MSTPSWFNVQVSLQSAIGASGTITGITKATTAVVSQATHGYTNGTYVLLNVAGMQELNGRVFRVANVTAGTYELEGINSTGFGTFTSGTAQSITFGTSFTTLKTVNASGGEFDRVDLTTIHDSIKKSRNGMASEAVFDFDSYYDLADTALQACGTFSRSQTNAGFLFAFPNGSKLAMHGSVGATLLPTGSTGEAVMTKITVTASGLPTAYNS